MSRKRRCRRSVTCDDARSRASLALTRSVDKLTPMPTGETGDRLPSRDEITAALTKALSSTPAVDEELWERRMRALFLRNMGGTFTQVATELGVHPDTARADVKIALREVMAMTMEDRLARQLSILQDLTRGAYAGAMNGDKDSIMAIVRCLEQEAKLCGMYAPTRQITAPSDIDFSQQAATLIGKLGLEPPRELMAGLGLAALNSGSAQGTITADVSEIIDGVLERITIAGEPIGFDIVASAVIFGPDSDEREVVGAAMRSVTEETLSRAAAEAITGGEKSNDAAPWSNL